MKKAKYIMIILGCLLGFCFPPYAESVDKCGIEGIASPGSQLIPESEFQRIFKEYLCNRLGKGKSDIIVSEFKIVGNVQVPEGKVSFSLFQKDKRRLEKYVRLVAIVSVNKTIEKKVDLSGWIDVFEPVVCSSRNLKKGRIIKKDDVYLARKNVSHLSPNILNDMRFAIGLMLKHNVKRDTNIENWMLEKAPIVKKGDMVTILAESADLKLTVPGRILEKGYLGELIKVQNIMSEKKIYARVIDNSTVMVDY